MGIFQLNAQIIQTFVLSKVPNKFCPVINTTKYSSWMVPECAPQIQVGVRQPSWKTLNAISP